MKNKACTCWHWYFTIGGMTLISGMFLGCGKGSPGNSGTKEFYFPVYTWKEPRVYVYTNDESLTGPVIWVYTPVKKDGGTFMQGVQYNSLGTRVQETEEQLVASGSLMQSCLVHTQNGQLTQGEVTEAALYPFTAVHDSGIYVYQLRWKEGTVVNTITVNRSIAQDTMIESKGKKLHSLRFQVDGRVENTVEGTLTLEYNGAETYVVNTGLYAYYKILPNGQRIGYTLDTVMTLPAYEKAFGTLKK